MNEFAGLIGRKVIAVDGSTLHLDNGAAFFFDLDGDCCSTSSYTPEGLEAFRELLGHTINNVEERPDRWVAPGSIEIAAVEDWAAREATLVEKYPPGDVDSWHFLVFTTEAGHVTVDWRNESNGYYDGSVIVREADPLSRNAGRDHFA